MKSVQAMASMSHRLGLESYSSIPINPRLGRASAPRLQRITVLTQAGNCGV